MRDRPINRHSGEGRNLSIYKATAKAVVFLLKPSQQFLPLFVIPGMKQLKVLLAVIVAVSWFACKNNKEKETRNPDTIIIKETEVQKDKTETKPSTETKKEDGTTIHMDDDGVSIENKDGNKETDVKVSKDSSRIIIKRPK